MKKDLFPEYIQKKKAGYTKYNFFVGDFSQNINVPACAVLGFVFIGDSLVLIKNKNHHWDIVGGKLEAGETIEAALARETLEEAGVFIDGHTVRSIGYFLCENSIELMDATFPKISSMPVCIAFANKVDYFWKKREILERRIASIKKTKALFLEDRDDNHQLLAVLGYVQEYLIKSNFKIDFKYTSIEDDVNISESSIVTTQCMGVCKVHNKFCIVRDVDESFFSLPGGGCELGELPIDCLKREIFEEAQCKTTRCDLMGKVIVNFYLNGDLVSQVTHDRYLCDLDEDSISDFIPNHNGFETIERRFVSLDELQEQVKILQNTTGDKILKYLKKQ